MTASETGAMQDLALEEIPCQGYASATLAHVQKKCRGCAGFNGALLLHMVAQLVKARQ